VYGGVSDLTDAFQIYCSDVRRQGLPVRAKPCRQFPQLPGVPLSRNKAIISPSRSGLFERTYARPASAGGARRCSARQERMAMGAPGSRGPLARLQPRSGGAQLLMPPSFASDRLKARWRIGLWFPRRASARHAAHDSLSACCRNREAPPIGPHRRRSIPASGWRRSATRASATTAKGRSQFRFPSYPRCLGFTRSQLHGRNTAGELRVPTWNSRRMQF
jgi:hypothetical protein